MESKVKLILFDRSVNLSRGAPVLKEILWYLTKILFFLNPIPLPSFFKIFILKVYGAKVGSGIVIKPRVNIHMPWKLHIGSNVWIGEEVFILNFEEITIGSNVCISQRAFLCGGNHDYKAPSMPYRNAPISLADGVWIGASCFIGPGVHIGTDTVVSAGSVITQSLDANGIYKTYTKPQLLKRRWS